MSKIAFNSSEKIPLRMSPMAWVMLLLLSLCWGSSFAFNEILLNEIPPITIVWGRQAIAVLLFIPISIPYIRNIDWSRILIIRLVAMGVLAIAIPFSLFSIGQQYITSIFAGIGNGTVPIFTLIMAAILTSDERFNHITGVGILIGFIGLLTLFLPLIKDGDIFSIVGFTATIAASAMYGFANVFARSIPKIPLQVQGLCINLSAMIFLTPAMLWESPDFGKLSALGWGAIILQGTVSSFFAYLLYLALIKKVGSVNTSQVAYLIPFSALFLGFFILDEPISFYVMISLICVLIGLWTIDWSRKNASKQ